MSIAPALLSTVLTSALLGSTCYAQTATTRPANTQPASTRPATQPAAGRDWVAYESKQHGFRFRVPKNWKRLELKSNTDVTDSIFIFDAAAGSKQLFKRQFKFMVGQPHGEPTLESAIQAAKDEAQRVDANAAFLADEPAEVAGQKAWRLEWDGVINSTRTTTSSNGTSKTEQIQTKVRRRETIWVENQKVCLFGVDSDMTAFPTLAKLADRVVATFERTK